MRTMECVGEYQFASRTAMNNTGDGNNQDFHYQEQDLQERESSRSPVGSIRIDHCYSQSEGTFGQILENVPSSSTVSAEASTIEYFAWNSPNTTFATEEQYQLNETEYKDMHTQTSNEEESHQSHEGQSTPRLREHCIFCLKQFETKPEIRSHLKTCTPMLSKILNPKKSLCLVCNIRWPSYSICGLIRHTISCLIAERECILLDSIDEPKVILPQLPTKGEEFNGKSVPPECQPGTAQSRNVSEEMVDSNESSGELEVPDELSPGDGHGYPNKSRCKFPEDIQKALNDSYEKSHYPSLDEKIRLGKVTGLSKKQICCWFVNQRRNAARNKTRQIHRVQVPVPNVNADVDPPQYPVIKPKPTNFILNEYYRKDPKPGSMMVLFEIATKTGLRIKQIKKWFASKRKSEKTKILGGIRFGPSPSKRPAKRRHSSEEWLSELISPPRKVPLKELTPRHKALKIKEFKEGELDERINRCTPIMEKVISTFGTKWKYCLEKETSRLEISVNLNNPFGIRQSQRLEEWQTLAMQHVLKATSSLYRTNMNFIGVMKVLRVWHPIVVYADILEMTLDDAVTEFYHKSFGRNEIPSDRHWKTPELLNSIHQNPDVRLPENLFN